MKDPLLIQEKRLSRLKECLSKRQMDLRLFLEDIKNYHNISAIIRTADATGVLYVYYTSEGRLPINDSITCGAHKWVILERVQDKSAFLKEMKRLGYKIVVTALSSESVDFRGIDYTDKSLIVMGNELEGVTQEVMDEADVIAKIPMHGMVQSLNVSVATALILYEAERQRKEKGLYSVKQVPKALEEQLLIKWGFHDVLKKKARGRLRHLV